MSRGSAILISVDKNHNSALKLFLRHLATVPEAVIIPLRKLHKHYVEKFYVGLLKGKEFEIVSYLVRLEGRVVVVVMVACVCVCVCVYEGVCV